MQVTDTGAFGNPLERSVSLGTLGAAKPGLFDSPTKARAPCQRSSF